MWTKLLSEAGLLSRVSPCQLQHRALSLFRTPPWPSVFHGPDELESSCHQTGSHPTVCRLEQVVAP